MALPQRGDEGQPIIKGFADSVLQEVIQADVSMHHAQLDAWKRFVQHALPGRAANAANGMPEQRYLLLDRVTLSFYIRSVEVRTLFHRVRQAWRILCGKAQAYGTSPLLCEICEASDPAAVAVLLEVSRSNDGKLEVLSFPNVGSKPFTNSKS